MSVKLTFNFGLGLLAQEADYILDAAEAFAAAITPRLPDGFVAQMRTKLGAVRGKSSEQKFKTADVGDLTLAQNDALKEVNRLVGVAKDAAKKAFAGRDVMLRNDFQVGIHSPNDLGSILARARVVRDSSGKVENVPLLIAKGWTAADTTALTDAIDALDEADGTQNDTTVEKTDTTGVRNTAANELYDGLLTVQRAADLQWPDNGNGNTAIRAKFRFANFPPKQNQKKDKPNGDTPPPAPPA